MTRVCIPESIFSFYPLCFWLEDEPPLEVIDALLDVLLVVSVVPTAHIDKTEQKWRCFSKKYGYQDQWKFLKVLSQASSFDSYSLIVAAALQAKFLYLHAWLSTFP